MKKRILSLILALSMVLSVFPLGAFAADPLPELVMKYGYPVGSDNGTVGCEGKGWIYSKKDASNPTGKLTLTSGTYNFSYTYPQNPNATGSQFVTAVAFEIQLSGQATITGGTFMGKVSNDYGTISNGTFESDVTNGNNIKRRHLRGPCDKRQHHQRRHL